MSLPRTKPRSPDRSGPRGEQVAAEFLSARGYRIVARNLRTPLGELDLVVRRGRDYAAVEVKARADHPAPERCVSAAQLDRMGRSLRALAPRLRPRPRRLQLDVVAVRWRDPVPPEVLHFEAVRRIAARDPAQAALRRTAAEVEAQGCSWPMGACITLRCAEMARRVCRWLRRRGRR